MRETFAGLRTWTYLSPKSSRMIVLTTRRARMRRKSLPRVMDDDLPEYPSACKTMTVVTPLDEGFYLSIAQCAVVGVAVCLDIHCLSDNELL